LAGESIRVKVGDHWYTVEIKDLSTSPVEVSVNGETVYVEIDSLPPTSQPPARPSQLRQPPRRKK
jgi:hypothetical protein